MLVDGAGEREPVRHESENIWASPRRFEGKAKLKSSPQRVHSTARTDNPRLYATTKIDARTLRRLEEERYREEAGECTFFPFVRSHKADESDTMFSRAKAAQNAISRGFVDALYEKLARAHAEVEECTFQPNITRDARYRGAFSGSTLDIGGVERFLHLQQQGRAKKEQTSVAPLKSAPESTPRNFAQEKMDRSAADIATRMKKHQRQLRTALVNILNSQSWACKSAPTIPPIPRASDYDLPTDTEEHPKAKSPVSTPAKSRAVLHNKRGFHRAGFPRAKANARIPKRASMVAGSLSESSSANRTARALAK
eukprot:GEMP01043086.1.p1 GENE.GEMP01043086.1~~GEMP01043086.1.p1  ORF type:complete len:311 (+),score=92.87 GEMP01043086.1:222-1154(+)